MGTATDLLTRPDYSFQAFAGEETKLRAQYLTIQSAAPNWAALSRSLDDAVRHSAVLLELFLVAACAYEALEAMGKGLTQLTPGDAALVFKRARETSGLDPKVVVDEAVRTFRPDVFNGAPPRLTMSAILLATRSLLEACPIDALEALAIRQQLEAMGHRCRVAYDGIQAFVLRNDPREDARIRILGQQYVEGLLSLTEVAQVLDLHAVDAVDLLERRNYARSIEVIRLDDVDRASRLAAIRARRKESGAKSFTHERVARDVIASERIEGVDARRWITREIP